MKLPPPAPAESAVTRPEGVAAPGHRHGVRPPTAGHRITPSKEKTR
ncbi:hypothetical protein ACFQ9Z_20115 [Streptomyces sp. NPDC056580]